MREQLEQELEELTASLFEVRPGAQWGTGLLGVHGAPPAHQLTPSPPFAQEAHRMVREANTKQAASEKQLKEARGKVRPSLAGPPAHLPALQALAFETSSDPGVAWGAGRDGPTKAQQGGAEV